MSQIKKLFPPNVILQMIKISPFYMALLIAIMIFLGGSLTTEAIRNILSAYLTIGTALIAVTFATIGINLNPNQNLIKKVREIGSYSAMAISMAIFFYIFSYLQTPVIQSQLGIGMLYSGFVLVSSIVFFIISKIITLPIEIKYSEGSGMSLIDHDSQ